METREILSRKMTKADVPQVAGLEKICFSMPWSEHALNSEMKNRVAHYRVLTAGKRIIAYAGMWIVMDEAHVTNIAVVPDFRNQGLGRRILLDMMQEARAAGAVRMTLEVREHNLPAQTLYAHNGFVKVGVRKGYYSDTGEAAYILWNDDLAATLEKQGGLQV